MSSRSHGSHHSEQTRRDEPVLWPDVVAFVRATLPPAPCRVLEIGAGAGLMATHLRRAGYDVLAVDPRDDPAPGVVGVALADVDEPPASFHAAFAVMALHHVELLDGSVTHLARLLEPGAVLAVDEFDVAALDERALAWWALQQMAIGNTIDDPEAVRDDMQSHLHDLATLRSALDAHFEVGLPVRGTYLHRWHLPPGLRDEEEALIGDGSLPAVGARVVARRRR